MLDESSDRGRQHKYTVAPRQPRAAARIRAARWLRRFRRRRSYLVATGVLIGTVVLIAGATRLRRRLRRRAALKIRAARRLDRILGSWTFLGAAIAFIGAWIALQLVLPVPFDAFPFLGLNLVLTVCAALQAAVLAISQRDNDK